MTEHTKHWIDAASILTAVGTILNWMPQIAALLSVVWMCIRLYEWAEQRFNLHRNRKP